MIVDPILRATWRELSRSRIRIALVLCFLLPGWLFAMLGSGSHPGSGDGIWFALILGAGLIGRPASNGTLALVLSRPVRRVDYVMTRWFAIASIAALLAVANLLILLIPALASHPATLDWSRLAFAAGEDIFGAAGMTAVLTLLSSLVGGIGDAALLALLILGAKICDQLGGFLSRPGLSWIGHHLQSSLVPTLDLETTFRSSPISWFAIAAYLSTVTLCLAAASQLLCRREISYASGGD